MGLVINLKADTGLVDRSENTTRFLKDVKDFPTLTREEEIEWFTKYKHGTKEEKEIARDYIMLCNQRMIIAAAKKWAKTDTLMDYVNEANFGLLEAMDRFDVTHNVKFASYAMWFIKRAINKYICGDLQVVKRPNYSKTFHVLSKATNDFLQKNERTPSPDELFDIVTVKYGKDIKDKNDILDLKVSYVDESANDEDESPNYGDVAAYNRASASYNEYEEKEKEEFNKKVVSSLLSKLSPRKQQIIKMRFGMYEGDNGLRREYEREEIGQIIGLTSERVRQLELEAMDDMKREYLKKVKKLV
jgi:RNA polymerase sigma factor (sigma-70 family)